MIDTVKTCKMKFRHEYNPRLETATCIKYMPAAKKNTSHCESLLDAGTRIGDELADVEEYLHKLNHVKSDL